MFSFIVKKIHKKSYLYIQGKVQLGRKKSIFKTAYLGPSSHPDFSKEERFKQEILVSEVYERTAFWKNKLHHKNCFSEVTIKKLEERRTLLNAQKLQLSVFEQKKLAALFVVDFVYNSNKIEGSKVPRKTIEAIVSEGKQLKNEEVINSLNALEEAKNFAASPSLSKIVKLHKTLLKHEPYKHGLRKEPIFVGNSETCPHAEIREKLSELLAWYKKGRDTLYPPDLAFTFYYRFERIHPFIDGNGRMGRILMNAILADQNYFPVIIWDAQRVAHFSAFESAANGQMKKFFYFMTSQFEKTYKVYLKTLTDL